MKIAFVHDSIYPYHKGGKEKRLFEIITRLAKKHEVHVYCMKWWNGPKTINRNGIYYHAISKYFPLYSKNKRSVRQGICFGFSCLKLIREDFDLIDADNVPIFPVFFVRLVCLLKKKKMLATWNEVWGLKYWVKYMGFRGIFGYLAEKSSVLLPDRIISISEFTTKKLIDDLGVNPEKIETVPVGINFDEIQKIPSRKIKNKIIFVGRLLRHKNADVLIRALPKIKQKPYLTIVGAGPEETKLKELTKNLDIQNRVNFSSLEEHGSVIKEIKSSSILVLPSSREGFGLVVIEANACGVPVITVDEKDNASKKLIINGKNGFVCRLNEGDIAKKIEFLLDNDFYKKMRKNCIETGRKYDQDNLTLKLERIYAELK